MTRKGAVRARRGELGIIPGSMGAQVATSCAARATRRASTRCSHGAGRAMSRGEAKRRFTLEDHAAATAGVECRKDADVIDETPMAYKDIDAVMAAQADLVEVVHTLSDASPPYRGLPHEPHHRPLRLPRAPEGRGHHASVRQSRHHRAADHARAQGAPGPHLRAGPAGVDSWWPWRTATRAPAASSSPATCTWRRASATPWARCSMPSSRARR